MLGVQSIWTLNSGIFVEKMCKTRVFQLNRHYGGIAGAPALSYSNSWFGKVIYMLFYHGQEWESFF
jgi:hypothetical protein